MSLKNCPGIVDMQQHSAWGRNRLRRKLKNPCNLRSCTSPSFLSMQRNGRLNAWDFFQKKGELGFLQSKKKYIFIEKKKF